MRQGQAKLRQRELEQCFADMGVVYADCLDTKFMKGWVHEAMETDAASVAERYRFIVIDTMMRCGPKVTPRFNGMLAEFNEAKQRREALEAFDLQLIAAAHCTGWRALGQLAQRFGARVVPSAVGKRFVPWEHVEGVVAPLPAVAALPAAFLTPTTTR